LGVRLLLQLSLDLMEVVHVLAQRRDLLFQARGLRFEARRLCSVRRLDRIQISLDTFLDMLLASIDLAVAVWFEVPRLLRR
jgi:hypothetical protein